MEETIFHKIIILGFPGCYEFVMIGDPWFQDPVVQLDMMALE